MSHDSDSPDTAHGDGRGLTRRRFLGTAAAAGSVALTGCTGSFVRIESAETTTERQFELPEVSRLDVPETSDDISVRRSDAEIVTVRAHKQAQGETSLSDLRLRSQVDDGTLRLRTAKPDVVGIGGGSIDLEILLPDAVRVGHLRTEDGEVVLRRTSGDATIESGDGDLVVSDARGDVSATTEDGSITIDGAAGEVTAESQDGDITVRNPGAIRQVITADGAIVTDVPAVTDAARVRSADGDVTARVDDAIDAAVDVTTDDGEITVAGALGGLRTVTERRVEATLGDGAKDLTIHTADGDVTVAAI